MKGHMENGKFHPHTEYKGVRKSRDQQVKTKGVRLKRSDGSRIKKLEFKVWKYEDAPPDLQEKIIEKLRQQQYEFQDDWFAQGDALLYDKGEKKDAKDIGLKYAQPQAYDVDTNRGEDFIQFDLEVEDPKKFQKYLGLSDAVMKKINYDFQNDSGNWGSNNTRLQFYDSSGGNTGGEINLSPDTAWADEHYDEGDIDEDERTFHKDDIPTHNEVLEVLHAHDKFADLMDDSLANLKQSYEYQFSDEALISQAEANEWEFNEVGKIS